MNSAPIRTLAGLILLAASAGAARGATLTFDELPAQPVHGLSTQGVAFGFEVGGSPSADATYNVDLGLGTTGVLEDSVLEGDALGLLTLSFAAPTPDVSFGLALLTVADLTPGAVVGLYDAGNVLLDSIALNTLGNPGFGISEGLFAYLGVPVSTVRIAFEGAAGRFALDNLTFTGAPGVIPEPGTVLAGVAACAFVGTHLVRRSRRTATAR